MTFMNYRLQSAISASRPLGHGFRTAVTAALMAGAIVSQLAAQEPAPAKPVAADAQTPQTSQGETSSSEKSLSPAKKPVDAALTDAERKPLPGNLWELVVAEGPVNMGFMGFLGLIALAATAVVLERLAHLTRGRVVPPDLTRDLAALVQKGESRPESFIEMSRRGTSPLANILRCGMRHAGGPVADVEKSME
ncbi:MAG TPA: hypothetical protein VGX76_16810, partial [Pirellulales bacterium]|nr:hypothetical protein [Pirellulales bacterium]